MSSSVVSTIVDILTNAITELTHKVIQFKAENAAVPPGFVDAVKGVCTASEELVRVARALAHAEYADYPSIQEEILSAATDVFNAVNNMVAANNALVGSSDRKSGWTGLGDACSIIAKKTILLLHIVYGAEVKKMFVAAANAKKALRAAENAAYGASKDPHAFKDAAEKASGDLNTAANQLLHVAQSHAVPRESKDMMDKAEALRNKGIQLIDDANKVLRDPGKDAPIKGLSTTIASVNSLLDDALIPLKDKMKDEEELKECARLLEELMKQLPLVAKRASENPEDADAQKALNDLLDRIEELADRIDNAGGHNPEAEAAKAKARAIIARMRPANARKGWHTNLLKSAKELGDAMDDLMHTAGAGFEKERAAQAMVSSARTSAAVDAALLGAIGGAAADIDSRARESKLSSDDPIIAASTAIGDHMARLARAAKDGDAQQLILMAKAIYDDVYLLAKLAVEHASTCPNPTEQDRLYRQADALKNFGTQLKILAAVKAGSSTRDLDSDKNLISLSRSIQAAIFETINAVEISKLVH